MQWENSGDSSIQFMFRGKDFVWIALVTAMSGCVQLTVHDPLYSSERRQWKENAIQEISRRAANAGGIAREMADLRTHVVTSDNYQGWLSDRLILMKNGEWLAYENTCAKEEFKIHDLFLAKSSDGIWYYSTFHFCVRMLSLKADERPESIAKFVQAYAVRPFDGQSDDCLKETWPKR